MSNPAPSPVSIAIGGLVALAAAMGVGRFIYTPILPFMVADLSLSKSEAGWIASANFVGYLIGALVASLPGFRGQRRAWLLGGLAASTLAMGLMAAFDTIWVLMVLRFVGGACSAVILIFTTALVLEWLAHAKRTGLASVHFAGVGSGIAISAGAVWLATQAGYDWRGQWISGAILSLAALTAAAWLLPNDAPRPVAAAASAGSRRPQGLWLLVVSYGLVGFGYVITATFLISIVRNLVDDPSAEAAVWMLVGIAAAPSVALWNQISNRIGLLKAMALACGVEAIGVAASIAGDGIIGPVFSAVLLGGTFMGITALGLAAAKPFATGGDMRRVTAAMTAAFGLGQVIGPSFAGVLFDWLGSFHLATLTAGVALLLAAMLAIILSRRLRSV